MDVVRSAIEPTEDNVFKVITNNRLNHNGDAIGLISLLNHASEFRSIAINGDWGSGKTFFVKQTKMLIDAIDHSSKLDERKRDCLTKLIEQDQCDLNKSILQSKLTCIYFDAWLYDDYDDPLKSLLLFFAQHYSKGYAEKSNSCSERLCSIVDNINIAGFFSNTKELRDSFQKKTTISDLFDYEEIKRQITEALNDMILDGQRMVIFVDELDRCNPSYAVKFLERIKHFFSSPKIVFVFAVNALQLSATIKNFYGSAFDSSRYLNKFFDITIEMPLTPVSTYCACLQSFRNNTLFSDYAVSIMTSLHMSLRDMGIYFDYIRVIQDEIDCDLGGFNPARYTFTAAEAIYYPLLVAYRTVNHEHYNEFINGNYASQSWDIISHWKNTPYYITGLLMNSKNEVDNTDSTLAAKEAFLNFYDAIFNGDKIGWDYIKSELGYGSTENIKGRLIRNSSISMPLLPNESTD